MPKPNPNVSNVRLERGRAENWRSQMRRVSSAYEGQIEREVGGEKTPSRRTAPKSICVLDQPSSRSDIVADVVSDCYLIPTLRESSEKPFQTP